MDLSEFSNQFDVLYNNITSNQAAGLNEYEKSIFLTKGQDEVIKNYFNPKGNKYQEGFDDSAKRQVDFSMLMGTCNPSTVENDFHIHHGSNVQSFVMPSDILLYINEFVEVTRNGETKRLTVVPLAYNEYSRLMSKPYVRPLKNQAWRLITNRVSNASDYYLDIAKAIAAEVGNNDGPNVSYDTIYLKIQGKEIVLKSDTILGHGTITYITVDGKYVNTEGDLSEFSEGLTPNDILSISNSVADTIQKKINNKNSHNALVELIPGTNDIINKYIVRYIRKPKPIILENLSDGLTLDGISEASECELDPSLHQEILQRAVELAKIAWSNTGQDNTETFIQAGQRSE